MANETPLTVIGNLTADPTLRFTPAGAAVADFTVAVTPRKFDQQTKEWKDGITAFWDCSVWREQAENTAESLQKGMRVIVSGVVKTDEWEDKNGGGRRTKQVIDVDEVGPSLKYANAKVQQNPRSGDGARGPAGQRGPANGPSGGFNDGGQDWQPQHRQSGGQRQQGGGGGDPWSAATPGSGDRWS